MEDSNSSLWSIENEIKQSFRQIQETTLRMTAYGVFFIALLFLIALVWSGEISWTITGILLSILIGFSLFRLAKSNFRIASWVLNSGLLVLVSLVLFAGGIKPALYLFLIPVGLTALTLDMWHGAGLAAILSLSLIFTPAKILDIGGTDRFIFILISWIILGMIWLLLNALLTSAYWAWSGYRNSMISLEQAREYQSQLAQSLDESKRLNEQFMRLNRMIQGLRLAADEERRIKQEFVANVSHELRTPLNMIIGFSEMIMAKPDMHGGKVPASLLSDLEVILRNSRHLSELIDDVLDLSQIEANRVALARERININEIVDEAVTAVQPLFSSKHLFLEVHIEPNIPEVWCDRTRIREVLLNLLSNAGRFTEQGGVTLKVDLKDNTVLVSVQDTGPGIRQEDQKRLFQPFQQLDTSIRRRHGGTGLGLAISKSFVELHDGKMWVESQEGRGTTFYFTLPIEPLPSLPTGPARWISSQYFDTAQRKKLIHLAQPKPRLIIVEKGHVLQKLFKRYNQQYEILTYTELETAINALEATQSMALLINEAQIGKMLETLKQYPLPFRLPVVICSIPDPEAIGSELGVNGYLVKPVKREELLSALEKLDIKVKTILLVDDESDTRQLFYRLLKAADPSYRVLRAENGEHALSILHEYHPDLILLDITMPRMDGLQFLAIKNQEETLRNIPVILVSAHDPHGQPLTNNSLAVMIPGGISSQKTLKSIESLLNILSPMEPPALIDQEDPSD